MRKFTGTCANNYEVILARLWEAEDWLPAHALDQFFAPYGHVGNSGEVRARELARNDPKCSARYHNKVERKRGSEIGLDPRFVYFRYKSQTPRAEMLRANAELVAWFDNLPDHVPAV